MRLIDYSIHVNLFSIHVNLFNLYVDVFKFIMHDNARGVYIL